MIVGMHPFTAESPNYQVCKLLIGSMRSISCCTPVLKPCVEEEVLMVREAMAVVPPWPVAHKLLAFHAASFSVVRVKRCEVELHSLRDALTRSNRLVDEDRPHLFGAVHTQGRGTGVVDETPPVIVVVAAFTVIFRQVRVRRRVDEEPSPNSSTTIWVAGQPACFHTDREL